MRATVPVALAALATAGTMSVSAQEPSLADALAKTAKYVAEYRTKISGVTLEEQMMLIELHGTVMRVPRRLASDLVFVNTGSGLVTLRDLFAIDTNPTRERTPRITNLLAEPTAVGWQRAQDYQRQGVHHFLADVVWWGSEPSSVLRFVDPEFHSRITYKLDGRKRIQGVQVIAIRFTETEERGRTYLLGSPGNARCLGRFWIDPATGAIHQTELWVESNTETVRGQTTYAVDPALGWLLPKEAGHTFDAREKGTGFNAVGRRLSLESTTKFRKPRYTKIDLSRIR
jgi:hypothetical protein